MGKTVIQFAHANGFPAGSYAYLFSLMGDFEFHYVERMGHGDHPFEGDLENLADELIAFIEDRHDRPVVGLGHSTGGVVTMLAASRRPELFRHLVLMDPVLLGPRKRWALRVLQALGLAQRLGIAKHAGRRRARFADRDAAAEYLRNRPLFMNWHAESFMAYIEHGFREVEGGVELAFSPAIEAEIFANVHTGVPAIAPDLTGTLVYGAHSNVFDANDVEWWRRTYAHFEVIGFHGSHLFPFEQPQETARLLTEHLARRLPAE